MKLLKHPLYASVASFALLVTMNMPVLAGAETPAEIAMLPAYCDAKMGKKSPEAVSYWIATLGHENWIHMHHYCGGLVDINRYYRQNSYERKRSLSNAVWQFNYMLEHTNPSFFMRADFHYQRGKAQRLYEKDGAALGDFTKALELNPGMTAASIELASLYKKMGRKELALGVLKAALEKSPTHKGLRRNYQEMGGNLAEIAESTPPPVTPNPITEEPATSGSNPSISMDAKPSSPVANAPAISDQKIGNQTNPWCRFCPDPPAEPNK